MLRGTVNHDEHVPVSCSGIARALGIRTQSAYNLWQRSKKMNPERALPQPVWVCEVGALWCYQCQIVPWAEKTGREIVDTPGGGRWEKRLELFDFLGRRGGY